MRFTRIVLAAALAVSAGTAVAGEHQRGPKGPVTREAAADRGAKMFAEIDANKDGRLTAEEFKGHMAKHADKSIEQAVEKLDANKDGFVDAAEFDAAGKARFAKADRDGDGVLSEDEMRDARKKGEGAPQK